MSLSSRQRRTEASARIAARQQGGVTALYAPQVAEAVAHGDYISRLLPAVYDHFERGIPLIGKVPGNEYEAAWVAGAEFVLRKLRGELAIQG